MKGIDEYESMKNVLESLSSGTQRNLKYAMKDFLRFLNSQEGLAREVTPDDLIEEARKDVSLAQSRLEKFYSWLQGERVEGYMLRGEKVRQSSAWQRVFSYMRSFYVYNQIAFEKKWTKRIPKPERRKAIKKDNIYAFFKVDEKEKKIYFDRELLQRFLSNLKLRDQAITLALLSSSRDSGELFRLNVGDIREQKDRKRIFLEDNREKTKILFRTFFSCEATNFIRRYIEQERADAGDDEPLFMISGNHGKTTGMTPNHLSSVYRDAAKKTGIKWDEDEWNPFRPKRLRHLFRSACDTVGVPELYINAFMGHSNSQGEDYSEIDTAKLELEYLRVEPYLTIYGETEELGRLRTEIDTRTKEQKERIEDLTKKLTDLNATTITLLTKKDELESKLEEATAQKRTLEPLVEFAKSFKSREELEKFLDLFKTSSVIKFPEQGMLLMSGVPEDKRVVVSEIFYEVFQKVWDNLSKQALNLVLQRLEEKSG